MTAKFKQPDFTSDDAATYKAAIDASIAVVGAVAAQFAAHEAATPDMTVVIDAGRFMHDGSLVVQTEQTTTTIANPVTNPYIVRLVLAENTGAYAIVYGVEDVSPVAPDIPVGYLPCCQFQIETGTAQITNSMITDERVSNSVPESVQQWMGAEYTVSTSDPSGGVDGDFWFKREA